jgi:hypothetical protein
MDQDANAFQDLRQVFLVQPLFEQCVPAGVRVGTGLREDGCPITNVGHDGQGRDP